jgi:chorismate-pyruvate lyase
MSSEFPLFDPTASLYGASCPPAVAPVSVPALPAYQRALLVADGTVTRFIEAWALEPVLVHRLSQGEGTPSPREAQWLGLDGQPVPAIQRSVLLTGRCSGQFFLYATSLILPGRLPPAMHRELEASSEGLGQIIAAGGLESRREGLWYGRESLSGLPEPVAALCDGEFLTRCYRLLAGGRPVMLITERFPWGRVPETQR